MKLSTEIITFLSAKTSLWFKAKNPLKLDLDTIFLSWELVLVFKAQSAHQSTDEMFFWLAQNILVQQFNHVTTYLSSACQHHVEVTQSYTFAKLIWLSTTMHNLLAFNTREISSNNSEKLSLLAWVKVHLQFWSRLRDLIPTSLFPRPKTLWSPSCMLPRKYWL